MIYQGWKRDAKLRNQPFVTINTRTVRWKNMGLPLLLRANQTWRPNAPIVEVPELTITRHVNEKGDGLLPIEEGSTDHVRQLVITNSTGRTDVEGGINDSRLRTNQIWSTNDAPIVDVPELQITLLRMNSVSDLVKVEKGRQAPNQPFVNINTRIVQRKNMVLPLNFYAPIKHEVPNDAPIAETLNYKSLLRGWWWSRPSRP